MKLVNDRKRDPGVFRNAPGLLFLLLLVFGVSCSGCSCRPEVKPKPVASDNSLPQGDSAEKQEGADSGKRPETPNDRPEARTTGELNLISSAFKSGERIPTMYTADGLDVSPPLSWTGVPADAKELVLICDDPDAKSSDPWVHWLIYKIPPTLAELPQGLPQDPTLGPPVAALQGLNSWSSGRMIGYRGPDPPRGHGTHHYHFVLYALDSVLPLESGVDKSTLLESIHGKVIEKAELIGTYSKE